ncbi:UMP kinase [Candidatus Nucleicultrix amoebiphila]|jgi:uridylate kinase|uniref:UMP kinase n=1 Tax=Candidatus Nucleicultrix amoebiphila TaxID=1509244 RepID=UPI000A26B4EF|nr:UMP kinase [Candidatus Nucleicultrix amoebiphila]
MASTTSYTIHKAKTKYHRVLLKISGEALMGDQAYGLDANAIHKIADEIREVHQAGIEICVVVGGGNIYRGMTGSKTHGIERATGDYMGMIGTVINALALQNVLESLGIHTRVQSAIPMDAVCEPYIRRRAMHHLEKGRVVIFAAGSGNPFFTTDTAAVLRASEMNCDVLLKGTKVDGIYSSDPKKDKRAKHFTELHYDQILADNLSVMDMASIALARDNNLPLIVFSILEDHALKRALMSLGKCTIVVPNNKSNVLAASKGKRK